MQISQRLQVWIDHSWNFATSLTLYCNFEIDQSWHFQVVGFTLQSWKVKIVKRWNFQVGAKLENANISKFESMD